MKQWERFAASDTALMLGQVCRYFHINPIYFLEEKTDDRYEQYCILEVMMLRLIELEEEQRKKQEAEAERKQKVDTSLKSPGTQQRVAPPSVDEVKAMIEAQ